MVYSRPELTISFSLAPAIRALKAGVAVMGIDPAQPPENLASRLRWTLSVVCVCVCVYVGGGLLLKMQKSNNESTTGADASVEALRHEATSSYKITCAKSGK